MTNKRRPKKITNLWSITQGQNETLKSYTKRFTTTYSYVEKPDEDFAIQAYIAGVSNESMKFALCGNDVIDIKGLISRPIKYPTHKR